MVSDVGGFMFVCFFGGGGGGGGGGKGPSSKMSQREMGEC